MATTEVELSPSSIVMIQEAVKDGVSEALAQHDFATVTLESLSVNAYMDLVQLIRRAIREDD